MSRGHGVESIFIWLSVPLIFTPGRYHEYYQPTYCNKGLEIADFMLLFKSL